MSQHGPDCLCPNCDMAAALLVAERGLTGVAKVADRAAKLKAEKAAAQEAKKKAAAEKKQAEAKAKRTKIITPTQEKLKFTDSTRFLSIDAAKVSGYTLWLGSVPVEYGEIRPKVSTHTRPYDAWQRVVIRPKKTMTFNFADEKAAWWSVLYMEERGGELENVTEPITHVVFEGTYARFPKAATELGKRRGRLEAYLNIVRGPPDGPVVFEVQASEWRRVVAEAYGFSWPSGGKVAKGDTSGDTHKNVALRILRERDPFKIDLQKHHDVAESALVGLWFVRTNSFTK